MPVLERAAAAEGECELLGTRLRDAACAGDLQAVRQILAAAGPRVVDRTDSAGSTALHWAAGGAVSGWRWRRQACCCLGCCGAPTAKPSC